MMRTIGYILLTGVLLGVLSTCNMLDEPEADKPAGEGNVRVSIQVDQGYPEAERSVFPQVALSDIDHYALWGAPVGSAEAELIPSFTTQGNPSVVLTEGVWNFTVKGYKADGALILQGELRNQTISPPSHALTVSVAPLREDTGSISVTITLPADSGITTVLVFKDGVEQSPALTVAGNQVIYSAADVAAGDYYYSFRLNNSAGNTLAMVSQIVQVRARLSSEKTIALTQANLNALPDTPAAPVIEAGDGQLTVSWTAMAMAGDYEVYYSNNTTPPATPTQTVNNMTTTIISSLTNGMTYYVWIKAKNSAGTSEFSPVVSGTPVSPSVPEGFVSISGATVTGSGSSGVFVSGRTVTVDSFVMAKYETTYELWYEVRVWAEANGYTFANQGREGTDGTAGAAPTTAKPVTSVSWQDVIVWCNAYSEKGGKVPVYTYGGAVIRSSSNATACDNAVMDKTQSGFRLPTEVEWEFAARGGNPSDTTNWNYTYAGSDTVGDVAWYTSNSGSNTHPVGTKVANSLGLYDMSGNVWEWCWDRYGSVSSSTPVDGPTSGSNRLERGGSWGYDASYAGVSYRISTYPSNAHLSAGFRIVCPPSSYVPAVPEGFVSISGATVTGSGSSGVFVSGRTVTVDSFVMAKYETTYELWYEVRVWAEANGYTFANQGREGTDGTTGATPTTAKNEPVTGVSWRDVMVWCNAYSEKNGKVPVYTYGGAVIRSSSNATADNAVMDKTQSGFRLPTEVEWEFAARGGNPSDTTNWNYTYAGSNTAGDVAWYWDNSGTNTHPVGEKIANSLGLYDMSGNVFEWCWDWYGSVSSSTSTDGATSGSYRLVRGGAWAGDASYAGVSYRYYTSPSSTYSYIGFRVVCPPGS